MSPGSRAGSEGSASEDRWRTWRGGSAGWVLARLGNAVRPRGKLGRRVSAMVRPVWGKNRGMVCPGAEQRSRAAGIRSMEGDGIIEKWRASASFGKKGEVPSTSDAGTAGMCFLPTVAVTVFGR